MLSLLDSITVITVYVFQYFFCISCYVNALLIFFVHYMIKINYDYYCVSESLRLNYEIGTIQI